MIELWATIQLIGMAIAAAAVVIMAVVLGAFILWEKLK